MTPTMFSNGDKSAVDTGHQQTKGNTHQWEISPFVGLGTSA